MLKNGPGWLLRAVSFPNRVLLSLPICHPTRGEVEPPEAAPALSPRQGLRELLKQGQLGVHRLFKLPLVKLCPQPAG